jgi:hypothetical protein
VEKTGLKREQIAEAERSYRDRENSAANGGPINYPDWIYRAQRERPLLIVHLLAIGVDGEDVSKQKPVVAWSISLPLTVLDELRVEYVVNTTWLREHYRDEIDKDEMAGDDD